MLKDKKTHSTETKRTLKPDPDMADGVVSDWEFKITLIDVLRTLMGKVDNLQEQMGNGSREMDTVRRKMLEIKRNTVREKNENEKNKRRKNIPDGLICCVATVEGRISELVDR